MPIQSLNITGIDISDPFLSGFTHDLRSPLFAVLGYLELLQKNLDTQAPSDKAIEYLRCAREAGHRLDVMVTDMLDVARFGHGSSSMMLGPVSVSNLFNNLRRTFNVIAQAKRDHGHL